MDTQETTTRAVETVRAGDVLWRDERRQLVHEVTPVGDYVELLVTPHGGYARKLYVRRDGGTVELAVL